jgi:hypothetical protein
VEVSLVVPGHPSTERRAFYYFSKRAAPAFAGVLDTRFWESLVPRLAHTYSFVWDAAVCIGALTEHVDFRSLPTVFNPRDLTTVTNQKHREVIKIYNRAIADVRQRVDRGEVEEHVVAVSCILFGSVEFQQRNVNTGTELVRQCSKILTDNLKSIHLKRYSAAGQATYELLTPFMMRRTGNMAMLGNSIPPQWSAENSINLPLGELLSHSPAVNEARIEFQKLAVDCYEAVRLTDFMSKLRDDVPEKIYFMSLRKPLLEKLLQWKTSFVASAKLTAPNRETDWIGSYLLMYWAVTYITMAACTNNLQTVYDEYVDLFAEMIEHAAVCLRHRYIESTHIKLPSGLDPSIVSTLYFCAIKCRDPTLRRRALRLMTQAPPEESCWAFVAPDRVVARLIHIEEQGVHCRTSASPDPAHSLAPMSLPPEERRFAYANLVGRLAPTGRQRLALELCRFELNRDGSRRLVMEHVWLDEGD